MLHQDSTPRFIDEFAAFVWETAKIVVISLAIILPIRYYLIQPFFVKGSSMVPNFHDRDYILVDKLGYRLNEPQRGDVIVFRPPEDLQEYYIKRIIGLPGETVEIKNNQVFIYNGNNPEGFALDEAYLPHYSEPMANMRRKIDPNEYFVMGDNRPASSDSRSWGNLNKSLITGRALIRLWPYNAIGTIPRVSYPSQ